MAFRFTMSSLLRLRQSFEHQRALALQRASLNLSRSRKAVAELDDHLARSAEIAAEWLKRGRSAAELHFAGMIREQLIQRRAELLEEVRRLEKIHQEAADAYQQALRERETLESMRARQLREYRLEQSRRQQLETDTIFLLRLWQKREG